VIVTKDKGQPTSKAKGQARHDHVPPSTVHVVDLGLAFASNSQVCNNEMGSSCQQSANDDANVLSDAQVESMDDGVTSTMKLQLLQTAQESSRNSSKSVPIEALTGEEKPSQHEHMLANDALDEEIVHENNLDKIKADKDRKVNLVREQINKENERHDGFKESWQQQRNTPATGKAETGETKRHRAAMHHLGEAMEAAENSADKAESKENGRHERELRKIGQELH